MAKKAQHDAPLRVETRENRLVISIGVRTLAHAVALSPALEEFIGEGFVHPEVTDAAKLAAAIVDALNREDEAGATLVHGMLDEAAKLAIEDGCEGVRHD